MKREIIMNGLISRGYEVQLADVVKNGVERKGITIGNGNIRPTIYTEQFEARDDLDDDLDLVVDEIIKAYEESIKDIPTFNMEDLLKWDYVKEHLQLCIQRKGNEDIVKRDFLDLEQYVRVLVGNDGSYKVKPEHLERFGVSEEVLFHAAWECTNPTLTATNMIEVIAEMMNMDISEVEKMADTNQIILSNQSKVYGAIAMCNKEMLATIANKYNTNLIILPSSIHECIVIPQQTGMDSNQLNTMVREVNETQVALEEQLSDHAYYYDRELNEVFKVSGKD